jgi:hypothetical protein
VVNHLARYYDSRTGTFCSADPLAGSPSDPQSWNRYPYGRNDPIDITDPSGKSWASFFKDLGLGALMAFLGPAMPFIALQVSLDTGEPPPWDLNPAGAFGGVGAGVSWNGTPENLPNPGLAGALGLPTMADLGGPIMNSTISYDQVPHTCLDVQFLVIQGNKRHIGSSKSGTGYTINSGSAAIAPEQFGYSNGYQMAKALQQYDFSGSVTVTQPRTFQNSTFTFTNFADVIGNKAGVPGQLPHETARQTYMRQFPGSILLELPGLPFPQKNLQRGTLVLPMSQFCPWTM